MAYLVGFQQLPQRLEQSYLRDLSLTIIFNSWEWILTMRYVLLCLMVLYCGCSKFESVGTHQQQDYEWKDSFSI